MIRLSQHKITKQRWHFDFDFILICRNSVRPVYMILEILSETLLIKCPITVSQLSYWVDWQRSLNHCIGRCPEPVTIDSDMLEDSDQLTVTCLKTVTKISGIEICGSQSGSRHSTQSCVIERPIILDRCYLSLVLQQYTHRRHITSVKIVLLVLSHFSKLVVPLSSMHSQLIN